jgi:hypothetical protein
MIVNNLLSIYPTPGHTSLVSRDLLKVPQFPNHHLKLDEMKMRLTGFARQAAAR